MDFDQQLRECGAFHGAAGEALGSLLGAIVEQLQGLSDAVSGAVQGGVVEESAVLERIGAIEKRISESVLPHLDSLSRDVLKLASENEKTVASGIQSLALVVSDLTERVVELENELHVRGG